MDLTLYPLVTGQLCSYCCRRSRVTAEDVPEEAWWYEAADATVTGADDTAVTEAAVPSGKYGGGGGCYCSAEVRQPLSRTSRRYGSSCKGGCSSHIRYGSDCFTLCVISDFF